MTKGAADATDSCHHSHPTHWQPPVLADSTRGPAISKQQTLEPEERRRRERLQPWLVPM